MREASKEVLSPILLIGALVGAFVGSAFLLLFVVDGVVLISRLGVNRPTPMDFARTAAYVVAFTLSQAICARLLRPRQDGSQFRLQRKSLLGRVAVSFVVTLVLAAVMFFVWLPFEL